MHPPILRTVTATRYVAALRTSSSVIILAEADDDGLYALKLHGTGQGARALVAEVVAGSIARALGLPVPELVLAHFAPAIADVERDAELRDVFAASGGLNLGVDYLPGAVAFDPGRHAPPAPEFAARIVVFDLYVMNVDRMRRPSNLLVWHDNIYLIDHGAALAFQYDWNAAFANPEVECPFIRDHVLLPFASSLPEAARVLSGLEAEVIRSIVGAVPDEWLTGEPRFPHPDQHRAAYVEFLARRRAAAVPAFVEAAEQLRRLG
jgi:hypothetical protein